MLPPASGKAQDTLALDAAFDPTAGVDRGEWVLEGARTCTFGVGQFAAGAFVPDLAVVTLNVVHFFRYHRQMETNLESRPVDMHVHLVGTGAGGTGCWLRVKGWHLPLAAFMTKHIGLSWKAFRGDFDRLYVELLLRLVRESSLGAAVIL